MREFAQKAFAHADINLRWSGSGTDEVGIDMVTNKELIKIDTRYFRPAEVDILCADPAKAKRVLGWRATTSFDDIIAEMMAYDLQQAAQQSRSS